MTRPWRIQYDGAYYHVLSRGNEGRDIFHDDEDREMFLETLGEACERFDVEIYAFVLMTNHYHILLQTTSANLSRAMQWFGVTYTRRFNNRHLRSGHLFQGRFKSILVENDAYVVELSCYIHRNPLRAGIVERLIDYRWSSYPVYAYGRKSPEWLKTDLILGHFQGENPRGAYLQKVQSYAGEEKRLWEDFRNGVILGTSQFLDHLKRRYSSDRPHREVPQQRGVVGRLDAEAITEQASGLLHCDAIVFKEKGRLYGRDKEKRDLMVFFLWERGSYTNSEIGDVFGITYTAVSHIVKQVKARIGRDQDSQKDYALINSQIKM
jgi:putative transposase